MAWHARMDTDGQFRQLGAALTEVKLVRVNDTWNGLIGRVISLSLSLGVFSRSLYLAASHSFVGTCLWIIRLAFMEILRRTHRGHSAEQLVRMMDRALLVSCAC